MELKVTRSDIRGHVTCNGLHIELSKQYRGQGINGVSICNLAIGKTRIGSAERRRREMEASNAMKRKHSAIDASVVDSHRKRSKKCTHSPKKSIESSQDGDELLQQEEKQLVPTNPTVQARRYQLEVLQVALERNTLVYLETGCGKTLIAVLLIKEIANQLRRKGKKRVIIFLAPTVHLVIQQSEVIRINTDLKVADYYGAKGVDGWNIENWKTEIRSNEVLVMTPQILLDALRHSFLKLEIVELVIFDECHHTQRHHPYAQIMMEYYHTSKAKPKIFGMTASPVIRKGVSSSLDCEDQMARLEDILDSKVYALEDRTELELYVPTPNQITKFYAPPTCHHEALKQKLVALREKYETPQACESLLSQFRDSEDFMRTLRKQIRSIHGNIEYCLEKLGMFCAYKATQIYMEREKIDGFSELDLETLDTIQRYKDCFLKEALQILENTLPTGMDKFCSTSTDIRAAEKEGLLTPKMHVLIQVLLSYRNVEEMRCIIFVERVIAAAVISGCIKQLDCLSYVSSDCLSGGTAALDVMAWKKQQNILDLLRTGKVNVLVATNVAEEGIDVQGCSCIIRFDLPKTVRSYIQSRGRARRPHSHYVMLIERNNDKQQKLLFDVIKSEESMRVTSLNRSHIPFIPESSIEEVTEIAYRVLSTGATVNCDSSVSFIYNYCAKLPGDKYYLPRPEFVFTAVDGQENLHSCILRLPPNALFQEVISPPSRKLLHAKQLACLEACKRLHELGALDAYLLPITETESEDEEAMNSKGKRTSGAGTTKRKELHSTSKAKALSGSWSEELNGVTLQSYKLVFSAQDNEAEAYANFVLLIEAVLADDIANAEIDLHLTAGRIVKSKFMPSGQIHLNSVQLVDAKCFQEIVCNGIFGKLVRHSKKSVGSKTLVTNLLGAKVMESLWVTSNMYFLLPLKLDQTAACHREVTIDWKCISHCASVARLFKVDPWSTDENSLRDKTELLQVGKDDIRSIQTASGSQSASDLIDKALVTIHTGRIYCVTEVLHGKTAESPFPNPQGSGAACYISYADYFEKKYGKKLNYLKQPLLRLKQSHRPHNLLIQQFKKLKGTGSNLKVDVPNYVELPPELCLNLGVQSSIIRSLYLIPSVMHRMNALMLGSQLREEIKERHNCPFIPATLIMQALTTTRCLESFSLERLELLGDSVLKYAVSCYVFLKYDKKHEGQLSARRSWAICNATLHGLAISRNLPGYIRDGPFDPRRWAAPGAIPSRIVACCCNTSSFEESVKQSHEKEDKVVKIGKACDKGHRWMCSKTIADSVEALIGAYLVGGGLTAALEFMSWMNIDVGFEPALVEAAFMNASVHPHVLRSINLHTLESQLGYVFQNKSLLVEAITHASQQDFQGGCCYQRLEFLGDSVLDLLITRHLFLTHHDLPPGVLTDLRSAAVNNENFAYVAVKHNLQKYLRHGSGTLLGQITEFVKAVQQHEGRKSCLLPLGGVKGPKVLGDLIESIAGAILVDSRFDLEQVWKIMKPILSPIVTPETLNLHPLREVTELCHLKGYSIYWKKSTHRGTLIEANAEVQLEDCTIVGTGCNTNKKTAKKEAAQQILLQMEERGIYHPRQQKMTCMAEPPHAGLGSKYSMEEVISCRGIADKCRQQPDTSPGQEVARKKARLAHISVNLKTSQVPGSNETENTVREDTIDVFSQNWSPLEVGSEVLTSSSVVEDESSNIAARYKSKTESEAASRENNIVTTKLPIESDLETVSLYISMLKGGPRTSLHELCKQMKWNRPVYEFVEQCGLAHSIRFVFKAVLNIPNRERIIIQGDPKTDKNSAKDSSALLMLFELEKQGLCLIKR